MSNLINRSNQRAESIKGWDLILGAFSPIFIIIAIILFVKGFLKASLIISVIIIVILIRIFIKSYNAENEN